MTAKKLTRKFSGRGPADPDSTVDQYSVPGGRVHLSTIAASASRDNGLAKWSFMPAASARSRSVDIALAVTAMMGRRRTPSARIVRAERRHRQCRDRRDAGGNRVHSHGFVSRGLVMMV